MSKQAISRGIVQMGDGRFEARVKYAGKSSNSRLHSMYVGMYNTLAEAKSARGEFIVGLF